MANVLRRIGTFEASRVSEAADLVADQRQLSEVVVWTSERGARSAIVSFVPQDEYTRDVVVRFEGEVHLVYGVT